MSFYLAEKKIREGQLFRGLAAARSGQSTTLLLMDHEKGKEQNPVYYLLQNITPGEYQQLYAISKKQNQSLD